MIQLTRKFPFFHLVKKPTSDRKYYTVVTGYTTDPSEHEEMVKLSKDQLIDHRISLHKIRFVCDTAFVYDVDNNVINPRYKVLLPTESRNPVIEIGKPQNTMTVSLGEYRTDDNYAMLKSILRKSKKGVALLIGFNYEEVMWLVNLDDAIAFYNESVDELIYEN